MLEDPMVSTDESVEIVIQGGFPSDNGRHFCDAIALGCCVVEKPAVIEHSGIIGRILRSAAVRQCQREGADE